jgi:hypothetical protein
VTNTYFQNPSSSFERPAVNTVTSNGPGRSEFALAEPTAPARVSSKPEPRENPWPELPAARTFDIADELASKDQEAEGLRRLEQEQRGVLWNE